ncbi:hypothetical protein SAMN02746089_01382 [Caldanaerobius fijiensis DSM 17918]|uniref:Uncharacterized protein n=1 Tax=Caldanaerobius fijiensis DSM 17918 TaxID=1121256 RepID=A0A1M4ZC87_9THEO|nr:DUF5685 family protein [Caldanaerobius fijiensis]SHF15226.1 hypothetical protein SAMN02746089_01382 [Caldanaerobius fijiensis DSM 17918]
MFGYIKPYKPEMKIKEYQVFTAYYCGLCKELGRNYGQISRFTLNYEFTFLAILLSALSDEEIVISKEGCIISPIKKRPVLRDNPFLTYAADMSTILTYYKFIDAKRDDKSVFGFTASTLFYKIFKKAKEKFPDKESDIRKHIEELNKLERDRCRSVDVVAEPFARILKDIFLYPDLKLSDEELANIAEMAYHIGRFIYIIDAFDDIQRDIEKDSYNPLLLQFEYSGEPIDEFKERVLDWVEFNLTFTLSVISQCYGRLKLKKNKGIVDNVIYLGLYKEAEMVLKGDKKKCGAHMKYWD